MFNLLAIVLLTIFVLNPAHHCPKGIVNKDEEKYGQKKLFEEIWYDYMNLESISMLTVKWTVGILIFTVTCGNGPYYVGLQFVLKKNASKNMQKVLTSKDFNVLPNKLFENNL